MNKPELEERHYQAPIEIKHTLIAIERLYCDVMIEHGFVDDRGVFAERARIEAKERIKDRISEYIDVEPMDVEGRPCVRAKLSLPFIYDKKMQNAESKIEELKDNLWMKAEQNNELLKQISYLKLPWYKKLIKLITHK